MIRDASGNLVRNGQVGMRISILQGSADGSSVYAEEYTVTTNANGLVSLEIGSASPNYTGTSLKSTTMIETTSVSGDFTAIDWADVPYFIKVETDLTGGTNYTITGVSQLLSVPYALHAKSSDGVSAPLELTGSTTSASQAIIKGTNNGSGYGIYGWSSSNYGVYGYSSTLNGIFGYSNDNAGVYGINGSSGNEGKLGTGNYGVYGSSTNGYSGYFDGKTIVVGGDFELSNPSGENWFSFLRGSNENAGFAFKENGATETQWIFPYFRGWQSDNLIIRDESASPKRDVMVFQAGTGKVGIGTVPETLLHISSGTDGDAVLLLEADTDNNNEQDQPSIFLRQDGGLVISKIGFEEGNNNLTIKTDNAIDFKIKDQGTGTYNTIGSIDNKGFHNKRNTVFVAPASFTPASDVYQYRQQDAISYYGSNSKDPEFVAQVNLPDGANILQITAYFKDNDGDNNVPDTEENRLNNEDGIRFRLVKINYQTRDIDNVMVMNTETYGSSENNMMISRDFAPGELVLDYSTCYYIFDLYVDALDEGHAGQNYNEMFYGAKIIYEY